MARKEAVRIFGLLLIGFSGATALAASSVSDRLDAVVGSGLSGFSIEDLSNLESLDMSTQIKAAETSASAAQATTGSASLAGTCKNEKTVNGVAVCYPDASLTPGQALPTVTKAQVCVPGYAGDTRNVSDETKEAIVKTYGIVYNPADEGKVYEIDHLVSLELGGSNDPSNLWPEPYDPPPGAREKDKVEDKLHSEVCGGTITLQRAQEIISTDWYSCYALDLAKQNCN
jgi:hypothetical protein